MIEKKGITDYNVHISGGGVCIYVSKKWSDCTKYVPNYTIVTHDFEIVTMAITKPDLRKLLMACVYKPPRDKLSECIKILSDISEEYKRMNYEIWFWGHFDTDLLRRDEITTVQITRFIKKYGLSQLIHGITRPNRKGGSCLDLIITDSKYVADSGILDDFISDHYTFFCRRKKKKKKKEMIRKK